MKAKIELSRNRGWLHADLNRPGEFMDLITLMSKCPEADFTETDLALVGFQFRKALTLFRCRVIARRLAENFLIERTGDEVYWIAIDTSDTHQEAQLKVHQVYENYNGELYELYKQIGGDV